MDMLGFLAFVFLVIRPPAWARGAWDRAQQAWSQTIIALGDQLPIFAGIIRSKAVGWFAGISVAILVAEYVGVQFFLSATDGATVPARFMAYVTILTAGQFALAVWNFLTGRVSYQRHPDGGIDPDTIRIPLASIFGWLSERAGHPRDFREGITRFSCPRAWVALVTLTALVQGLDIQIFAMNDGFTLEQARLLVVLGFVSKVVYAISALTAAALVAFLIKKGTRLVEWTVTLAAKFGLAIAPHIEFDTAGNHLGAGGEVDLIDEDGIANALKKALGSPFVMLVLVDIAIFLWPNGAIFMIAVATIACSGLAAWFYARSSARANWEVERDAEAGARSIYKIMALLVPSFLGLQMIVMAYREEIFDIWYGVTYYAHASWWKHLISIILTTAAIFFLFWVWRKIHSKVEDGAWQALWYRIMALVVLLLVIGGTVYNGFLIYAGAQAISGTHALHLQRNVVDAGMALGRVAVKEKNGTVQIRTEKPASGIIEFNDPQAAQQAGLPSYLRLTPTGENAQGESTYYGFIPPEARHLSYRLVLRNAEERSERIGWVEIIQPNALASAPPPLPTNQPHVETSRWGVSKTPKTKAKTANACTGKCASRTQRAPRKRSPEFEALLRRRGIDP